MEDNLRSFIQERFVFDDKKHTLQSEVYNLWLLINDEKVGKKKFNAHLKVLYPSLRVKNIKGQQHWDGIYLKSRIKADKGEKSEEELKVLREENKKKCSEYYYQKKYGVSPEEFIKVNELLANELKISLFNLASVKKRSGIKYFPISDTDPTINIKQSAEETKRLYMVKTQEILSRKESSVPSANFIRRKKAAEENLASQTFRLYRSIVLNNFTEDITEIITNTSEEERTVKGIELIDETLAKLPLDFHEETHKQETISSAKTMLMNNLTEEEVKIDHVIHNCLYSIVSSTNLDFISIPSVKDMRAVIKQKRVEKKGIFIEHTLMEKIRLYEKSIRKYVREEVKLEKYKNSPTENVFAPVLRIVEPVESPIRPGLPWSPAPILRII